MLCASCHGAPHRIRRPDDLGRGTVNNCDVCHMAQVRDPEMGPNCGACHGSSWDPHQVEGEGDGHDGGSGHHDENDDDD